MEKKELTVRDLIKKLLDFNPDAKVTINLTGVPFPLYSDFSFLMLLFSDVISLQYQYHFLQQKEDMLTHSLDPRKGYKDQLNRNLHEYKSRKFRTRISQIIVLYP